MAHRHGRGPDFLIHDSHLYDGVDERQIAKALSFATTVTEEERMQYIVTINTDSLSVATQRGFDPNRTSAAPASPTNTRPAGSSVSGSRRPPSRDDHRPAGSAAGSRTGQVGSGRVRSGGGGPGRGGPPPVVPG
ncbi:DUF2326 domain-containing protein [Streptomyces sp. NBC_00069]|uniref:DUF2326 domain-containing protein n=1 Tax=Streptomyces sp. NBC_00069 TaxID=2975639 RepID=UPI00386F061C